MSVMEYDTLYGLINYLGVVIMYPTSPYILSISATIHEKPAAFALSTTLLSTRIAGPFAKVISLYSIHFPLSAVFTTFFLIVNMHS